PSLDRVGAEVRSLLRRQPEGGVPDRLRPPPDPVGGEPRAVAAARAALRAARPPARRARHRREGPEPPTPGRPGPVLRGLQRRYRARRWAEPREGLAGPGGEADRGVRAARRGRMSVDTGSGTAPASPADLDPVATRALELTAGARTIGFGSGRAATSFIRS